ncbi:MAG: cupin domain-containing protein [Pseudomonadota bacterium]
MTMRRIVTGIRSGKSVVVSDAAVKTHHFAAIPGASQTNFWGTDGAPKNVAAAHRIDIRSILPPANGSRFMMIDIPPDSTMMSADFNPAAATAEYKAELGDFADCFELENPGMHTTPTLDYGFVISGTPVLELDDGETVPLKPGDVVVQCATRHAWRNPTDTPAQMLFVLLGEAPHAP